MRVVSSGALASVAGFAFKGEAGAFATNWHALVAAFGALSVFWIAIWVLDFAFYNLSGALTWQCQYSICKPVR